MLRSIIIFIFSEQYQILHQYIHYFNEIINSKIKFEALTDVEQHRLSYMVRTIDTNVKPLFTKLSAGMMIQ